MIRRKKFSSGWPLGRPRVLRAKKGVNMKTNLANALRHGAAPVVLGIALLAGPAYAQTASIVDGPPPAPAAAVDTSATIVVTGTRIANPNLKSAAPITTISALDLKAAGTSRTEDILNQLPQVLRRSPRRWPMARAVRPKSTFAVWGPSVRWC
jgi:outer membrane receptor protein involved in Fe transport